MRSTLLARKQPEGSELASPRRSFDARQLRISKANYAALRRALELQVDQALVLDAIASCKAILAIRPDDEQTLETLDLLYLNRRAL